jgi:hypothetical protein
LGNQVIGRLRYVEAFYSREIRLVDFACDRDTDCVMVGAFCAVLVNENFFQRIETTQLIFNFSSVGFSFGESIYCRNLPKEDCFYPLGIDNVISSN